MKAQAERLAKELLEDVMVGIRNHKPVVRKTLRRKAHDFKEPYLVTCNPYFKAAEFLAEDEG